MEAFLFCLIGSFLYWIPIFLQLVRSDWIRIYRSDRCWLTSSKPLSEHYLYDIRNFFAMSYLEFDNDTIKDIGYSFLPKDRNLLKTCPLSTISTSDTHAFALSDLASLRFLITLQQARYICRNSRKHDFSRLSARVAPTSSGYQAVWTTQAGKVS